MKYYNVIMGIGVLLIIVSAVFKILHLQGSNIADIVGKITFYGLFIMLILENTKLKKQIKIMQEQ